MLRAFTGEQTRGYGPILGLVRGISTYEILNERIIQCVPRPGIVPIPKTNPRETKNKQIQCFQGVTFALIFLKKHIICHFVTPMLHPNQELLVPLQPTETKGK